MQEIPTPPERPKSSTGIEPNVAGLLCYLLTWLTGLIFYLIEKENKDVRFHAMQAILFGVAIIVVGIAIAILGEILTYIPIIGAIIYMLLGAAYSIGVFALWIILMIKAYQGGRYKLPVLGDMAEKYV
ncbi:MAG: DUF4870 domain-containing protein [Actinomycetota bacterium]|nr:DUF4870 domain-containing protein [Actinomycetota bacterium]